jgi:hypothetical protein
MDFDKFRILVPDIIGLTVIARRAIESGDATNAVIYAERKHNLILQVFGENESSTGTSLIDLSRAHFLAGRLRDARSGLETAFEPLHGVVMPPLASRTRTVARLLRRSICVNSRCS